MKNPQPPSVRDSARGGNSVRDSARGGNSARDSPRGREAVDANHLNVGFQGVGRKGEGGDGMKGNNLETNRKRIAQLVGRK